MNFPSNNDQQIQMQGLLYPIPRANPYSKGTDLICRLPLPTLFQDQRLLTLGTWCGCWYGPVQWYFCSWYFKEHHEHAGHSKCCCALAEFSPYRGLNPFQGALSVKKKRQLFPGLVLLLPGALASPPYTDEQGSGILTRLPFVEWRQVSFQAAFACLLGPTNPCPNAVHMETFPTSVLKDLTWVFATTTKICTRDCFMTDYSDNSTPPLHLPTQELITLNTRYKYRNFAVHDRV